MPDIVYALVRCNAYTAKGTTCERTTSFPVSPATRVASMNWRCPVHSLMHIGKCYRCDRNEMTLAYHGRGGGLFCTDCISELDMENHGA